MKRLDYKPSAMQAMDEGMQRVREALLGLSYSEHSSCAGVQIYSSTLTKFFYITSKTQSLIVFSHTVYTLTLSNHHCHYAFFKPDF